MDVSLLRNVSLLARLVLSRFKRDTVHGCWCMVLTLKNPKIIFLTKKFLFSTS